MDLIGLLENAWTAYSFWSSLAGLSGVGLIALSLIGTAWLPDFIKRPLMGAGIVLVVCSAIYQAGQAKGVADANAKNLERALQAERLRTIEAEAINRDFAQAATDALVAEQADKQKLKDTLDAILRSKGSSADCLTHDDARRLRDL